MVWADATLLDHDHMIFYRRRSRPPQMRQTAVTGGYFLLSDNRSYTGEDSRAFGEVDGASCVGRVFLRLTAADSPPEIGNGMLDILE